ncbi:MAG: hypothetical protein II996_05450 [Oscillospiraceae bacterium]|nr:hypothetical protein [Oscillospiraceae bacterium]
MRKYIALVLALVCVMGLVGCSQEGNKKPVDNVQINYTIGHSEIYDENSIKEAFSAVEKKFSEQFVGCTLTELSYNEEIENRFADKRAEYATESNLELIILLSTFTTDENGGDGSLEPNATYTDWQWHLVRSADNKSWEVRDWGVG